MNTLQQPQTQEYNFRDLLESTVIKYGIDSEIVSKTPSLQLINLLEKFNPSKFQTINTVICEFLSELEIFDVLEFSETVWVRKDSKGFYLNYKQGYIHFLDEKIGKLAYLLKEEFLASQ